MHVTPSPQGRRPRARPLKSCMSTRAGPVKAISLLGCAWRPSWQAPRGLCGDRAAALGAQEVLRGSLQRERQARHVKALLQRGPSEESPSRGRRGQLVFRTNLVLRHTRSPSIWGLFLACLSLADSRTRSRAHESVRTAPAGCSSACAALVTRDPCPGILSAAGRGSCVLQLIGAHGRVPSRRRIDAEIGGPSSKAGTPCRRSSAGSRRRRRCAARRWAGGGGVGAVARHAIKSAELGEQAPARRT